ncbi:hypothetical protein HC891_09185, partial [Candidatus Gracilibacteria bacterium]|nr:hypothetical protein [Candidatus Gracilibacteria bacterium]
AAAVGTGVVRSGVLSSSIGTSGVLFAHSDAITLDPLGRLHSFCHAVPGQYHLMAVTLSAGGAFQWFRNLVQLAACSLQLAGGASDSQSAIYNLQFDDLIALATPVAPGAEGLLFLPYLSGERTPHLDPLARGAFVGLTTRHTLGHMARAVMEGVVFALRDGLEIMRELGVPIDEIRATGGGGKSALWRQLQADIYRTPLFTLAAEEGPAYGAALLAGVGTGVYADVQQAVTSGVRVVDTTEPNAEAAQRYDEIYSIYRTVYSQLRGTMHRLAALGGGFRIQNSEFRRSEITTIHSAPRVGAKHRPPDPSVIAYDPWRMLRPVYDPSPCLLSPRGYDEIDISSN